MISNAIANVTDVLRDPGSWRLPEDTQGLYPTIDDADVGASSHHDNYAITAFLKEEVVIASDRRDSLYIVLPITVIYAVIFFTGVIGNISTCVVIARNKSMHTTTNYYLFSLAVSDLLLLVSGLPLEMYYMWSHFPYISSEAFCIIQSFAAETSANATVLTITAFTVERYVAICHPFISHTRSKLSRAVKFVVVIWLLALCLAMPQALQFGIIYDNNNGTINLDTARCSIRWTLIDYAFEISTILLFVMPMTIIIVLYVLIAIKLRRSSLLTNTVSKKHRASGGLSHADSSRGKTNAQRNVIRMLVAVVVAFFICWAPFHAQRLLAVYIAQSNSSEPEHALVLVCTTLTYVSGVFYYLSTTVNPLLYNIMSNKFREAFKSMLPKNCVRKYSSHVPTRNCYQSGQEQSPTADLQQPVAILEIDEASIRRRPALALDIRQRRAAAIDAYRTGELQLLRAKWPGEAAERATGTIRRRDRDRRDRGGLPGIRQERVQRLQFQPAHHDDVVKQAGLEQRGQQQRGRERVPAEETQVAEGGHFSCE